MLYICPKCKMKLSARDNRAVCTRGHSYDRAREGYYNLLLSNTQGSHGDNREMINARRTFLSQGFYNPLAEKIAELVLRYTKSGAPVLDAGCGEGYYTDIIERSLSLRDGSSIVLAFDISKDAVKAAAKKNRRLSLAVAGSYHMPIEDLAISTVVNTFSPMAREETLRVLSKNGIFIMAIPASEHLFELKAAIYDNPYKNTVENTALEGFELLQTEPLRYTMHLEKQEDIKSLFMMTPYAYRTKKENKERIFSKQSLDCTADFLILVYRKI